MERGRLAVAASLVAILVTAVALALLLDVSGEPEGPGVLRFESVDVEAVDVTASHVDLGLRVSLERSAGLEGGSVEVRAYDRDTGLLVREVEAELPRSGGEGVVELNRTVSLERDRGYELRLDAERGNRVRDSRRLVLSGLDTLPPRGKELKASLKDVDFQVREADGDRATVTALLYLEALRDYDDARLHVKAVQHESGLLADETWTDVPLRGGETLLVTTNLTVPTDLNYVVTAEAWRNDSLRRSWSRGLNLAPTRTVPRNVTEEEIGFRVERFERTPTPRPVPGEEPPGAPTPVTPGPGAGAALAALGAGLLWRTKT